MIWNALFLASVLAAPAGDAVVARVDGAEITRGAVVRRLDALAGRGVALVPAQAVDNLVVEALLAEAGRRAGLAGSPALADFVKTALQRSATRALVESIGSRGAPDEATLREMFHATADFVRYEFLTYATEEDARAALKRLQGGAKMEEEAKRAVVARLAGSGDVPSALRGQLVPELAKALFAAAPGQIVGPVRDDAGFALTKVISREIGGEAAYAARRPSLVVTARKQAADAARAHVVKQLRAKAKITIDEAFLDKVGPTPSAEQLRHAYATVDGAPLRYAELHEQLRALGAQAGHMAAGVRTQLAHTAIDERLLQDAALSRGLDRSPEVLAERPEIERNGLAALYAESLQSSVPAPTAREIEAHYKGNAARFGPSLERARAAVAAELAASKRKAALDARIADLRRRASITVDADALAGLASGRG